MTNIKQIRSDVAGPVLFQGTRHIESNDGFTHTGNGLAVPGADNFIEIGYLKLGAFNSRFGLDGSAFGQVTMRSDLSVFTIDRVTDTYGNYTWNLAGTEIMRLKYNNLVLKNSAALDLGEFINGPSRLEGASDVYLSSVNNGTSKLIFRPSYFETLSLTPDGNAYLRKQPGQGLHGYYLSENGGSIQGGITASDNAGEVTVGGFTTGYNRLSFKTDNNTVATVLNGNFGINETSPATKLSIRSNSSGGGYRFGYNPVIELNPSGSSTFPSIIFNNNAGSSNFGAIIWQDDSVTSQAFTLSAAGAHTIIQSYRTGTKGSFQLLVNDDINVAAPLEVISSLGKDLSLGNAAGTVTVKTLTGTGTRMVVADSNGVVSSQAIPSSATLQSTYVGFGSGANALTGEPDFTYNATTNTLKIGGATPTSVYNGPLVLAVSSGVARSSIFNSDTTSFNDFIVGEDDSNVAYFRRHGSTAGGNYTSTDILKANTANLNNNASALNYASAPMIISGDPVYNLIGVFGSNMGTRLDAVGWRLDAIANIHTANIHRFSVDGVLSVATNGDISLGRAAYPMVITTHGTNGSKITYNGKDKIIFGDETLGSTTINSTGTNASIGLTVNGSGRMSINDSGSTQIIGSGLLTITHDGGVSIPRSTIGYSLSLSNSSYSLNGDATLMINDGSSGLLGIGYTSNPIPHIRQHQGQLYLQGGGIYGVFVGQSSLHVNGNARIGDSLVNTGHTLEVAGDLQVTMQSGIGDRIVEADSNGVQSASKEIISAWITYAPSITILTEPANWDITGAWIVPTPDLTDTYQGQMYFDGNYFYLMVADNTPIRLIRG